MHASTYARKLHRASCSVVSKAETRSCIIVNVHAESTRIFTHMHVRTCTNTRTISHSHSYVFSQDTHMHLRMVTHVRMHTRICTQIALDGSRRAKSELVDTCRSLSGQLRAAVEPLEELEQIKRVCICACMRVHARVCIQTLGTHMRILRANAWKEPFSMF
jgi:hypothetical protein